VVTLQAVTCAGGLTLAREQVQADNKEHVLSALGTAANAMRAKLGGSRSSIQKLNRPLEESATGSLEALQNYTKGLAALGQGGFLAAFRRFSTRYCRTIEAFRSGTALACAWIRLQLYVNTA